MQIIPPPLPAWDGIHPLVVHFPIALLIVAPVFVLLGILLPRRGFSVSALVLMVIGVASAWVATSSGEAAFEVMAPEEVTDDLDLMDEISTAAEAHGEQTELARNIFTGLTLVYAVVLGTGALASSWRGRVIPQLVVLLAWAPALGYLSNAAHSGGELVHRFGVRALLPEEEPAEELDEESEAAPEEETRSDDAEDSPPAEAEADAASPVEPPLPAQTEGGEEPAEPTGTGDAAEPAPQPEAPTVSPPEPQPTVAPPT